MLKEWKRIVSITLAAAMLITVTPETAYAAEALQTQNDVEENSTTQNDEEKDRDLKKESSEVAEEGEEEASEKPSEEPSSEPTEAISPSMEPRETEIPSEEPAAIPSESPEETVTPTVEPSDQTDPSIAPSSSPVVTPVAEVKAVTELQTVGITSLAENTTQSVTLNKAAENLFQFTASQDGEYVFFTKNPLSGLKSSKVYGDADKKTVKAEMSTDVTYDASVFCTLKAGETVYWGITCGSTSGYLQVSRIPEMDEIGTVSDINVVSVPYGFTVSFTFKVTKKDSSLWQVITANGYHYKLFTLAYTRDSSVDLQGYGETRWNTSTIFNDVSGDVKQIAFDDINATMNYNNNTVVFTADTRGTTYDDILPVGQDYSYAIIGSRYVEEVDNSYHTVGHCAVVSQGTVETGKGVEETVVSIESAKVMSGYSQAYMEMTVKNPNEETLVSKGFTVTSDADTALSESVIVDSVYEAGVEIPSRLRGYYVYKDKELKTITVEPWVQVRTGAEGTLQTIKGEKQTVARLDTEELQDMVNLQIEPGVTSARISWDFDPKNTVDDSLYMIVTSDAGSKQFSMSQTEDNIYKGSGLIENLKENSECKVTVRIGKYSNNADPIYEKELTFSTRSNVVYTEADFPDANFRTYLQSLVGAGNTLSTDTLEKITSISINADSIGRYGMTGTIKSIKGIEYLTNLTNLTINAMDIEDISGLAKLKRVEYAYLRNNQITKIPDLRGMTDLKSISLDGNRILKSEFDVQKLPVSYSYTDSFISDANNQRAMEPEICYSDSYVLTQDGKVRFVTEVDQTRRTNDRKAKVTVSIGGIEYNLQANDYGYETYNYFGGDIGENLTAGEYQVTIKWEDLLNGESKTRTGTIKATKSVPHVEYEKYIDKNKTTMSIEAYIPAIEQGVSITSMELVDANKKVLAKNRNSAYTGGTNLYEGVSENGLHHGLPYSSSYNTDLKPIYSKIYGDVEFYKNNFTGKADLIISLSNGNQYKILSCASTGTAPKVTSARRSDYYNSDGDYFYLEVQGENLNYDKFWPVLKNQDGKVVSELEGYKKDTFILKKLDGFDQYNNGRVYLEFETAQGYTVENYCDSNEIYISGNSGFDIVYDAKAKKYYLYLKTDMPQGTEIQIGLDTNWVSYDYDSNEYKFTNKVASAAVVVQSGRTEIDFRDANNNFYPYYANGTKYYGASWETPTHSTGHCEGSVFYTESGFGEYGSGTVSSDCISWTSGTYQNAGKKIDVAFTYRNNTILKDGDVLTVKLEKKGTDGSFSAVESKSLSTKLKDHQASFACAFSSSGAQWEKGIYRVSVYFGDRFLGQRQITLTTAGNFYMTSQSSYSSGSMWKNHKSYILIAAYVANAADLKAEKLQLKLYDKDGKAITDVKIYSKEVDTQNNRVKFYLDGAWEDYNYLYCKILYDGKVGLTPGTETPYYQTAYNGNAEYGIWTNLTSNPVYFSYNQKRGYCSVQSNSIAGYTVSVYKDETLEKLTSFKVNETGYHPFTKYELAKVMEQDPDFERLYTLTVAKDGYTYYEVKHINLNYGNENPVKPKPATGISITPKTMTMNVGESKDITVKLTPDDCTEGYGITVSNPDVIALNENEMKVVAVGAGTAVIKVRTVTSGKEAACTVTVNNYKISDSEKTLWLGTDENTCNLGVYNGESKIAATWSSDNTAVATVDKNGKVTAIGKGTAVITAQKKGVFTLSCAITVKRELNRIAFTVNEKILETGDTDQLTVTFVPAGEATDVTYKSTNEAVITVEPDGIVTAVGEGTATVTAEAVARETGEKRTTECIYTVKASDRAEPIAEDYTIHAISGVDQILDDLSEQLPEKWSFSAPDTGLAAFAGAKSKEFQVVHINKNTGEIQTDTVRVVFSTVTGITVEDMPAKMVEGDKVSAGFAANVGGTEFGDRKETLDLKWNYALNKKDIIALEEEKDGKLQITGVKAGTVKLTAAYMAKDKTLAKTTVSITVVKNTKGMADISVSLVEKKGEEKTEITADENGLYTVEKDSIIYLKNDTENYSVGFSSSDTGILKTGKQMKDTTLTPVTLAKPGIAVVTAKAADTLGSTKTYRIKVVDRTAGGISLSTNAVSLNTRLTDSQAQVMEYNGFGGKLVSAEFAAKKNGDRVITEVTDPLNGVICIQVNGDSAATIDGNLTVTVADPVDAEKELKAVFKLKVTIVSKLPTVTVKQTSNVDTTYNDSYGVMTVGVPGEEITAIRLLECGYEYDYTNGHLTVKNNGDIQDRKGILEISLEGYKEPVRKEVSIKTDSYSFKLTSASGTIYKDLDVAGQTLATQITNGKTKIIENLGKAQIKIDKAGYAAVVADDGKSIIITADKVPSKKETINLAVKADNWNSVYKFKYVINPAELKKAGLKLSTGTVTVYNYVRKTESGDYVNAVMGNGSSIGVGMTGMNTPAGWMDQLTITGNDAAAREALGNSLNIFYDSECNQIKVKLNGNTANSFRDAKKKTLANKTYRYVISLKNDALANALTTTLTVKVENVDLSKTDTVAVKAKGSIDVLNRKGTYVTFTPEFKKVGNNTEVTGIALTGKDADIFTIASRNGNSVNVQLKENASVITKYNYEVAVQYTLKTGDTVWRQTSKPVKIKLAQGKLNGNINGSVQFGSMAEENKEIVISAANSVGEIVALDDVKLVTKNKDFSLNYDKKTGKCTLTHSLNGATVRGKSYKLSLALYPEGRGDNEKPVSVNCQVQILK